VFLPVYVRLCWFSCGRILSYFPLIFQVAGNKARCGALNLSCFTELIASYLVKMRIEGKIGLTS
jgi:hypothetical protein